MMDMSIIIVTYHTCDMTLRCLHRLEQNLRETIVSYEMIVIDNHSQDATVAEIRRMYGERVRVICNDRNMGFSYACNQGLRVCQGRYVLLFNSDAEVIGDALIKLMSYMDAHPDCAMVGGQLLYRDGSKQHSFDNEPSLLIEVFGKTVLRRFFADQFPSKAQEFHEPRDVESLIGACLLVRQKHIDRVGMLDEDYFFFMEETDWCRRMRQAGYRVVFFPDACIYHDQGQTAANNWIAARVEYWISKYTFYRKVLPLSERIIIRLVCWLRITASCFVHGILSLAKKKRQPRFDLYRRLWLWHLCGCPRHWGLIHSDREKRTI